MNNKKISPIFLIVSLFFSSQTILVHAMSPMPNQQMPTGPGGQPLSLEDLQAMEQFVEAERAKMTDEQRAQFDQDVVQLTKEFEKMQQENPEQFNTFIDQMLFGQPTEEAPAPMPEALPQEAPAPIPTPEESSKAQVDREKQDEALKRINAIIKHTNSFLNKTAVMVEFPGKLKKWAEQGKIRGWIPGYTWESIKNNVGIKEQIEKMLQKLNALKEQDRATKTYKYLDAVITNEALYKNLGTLERKLKELEPQVEIDEFGLEPATKEVRAIMRSILGEYVNALFALAITQDIDSVIAAFEPTAKKYRDEEETSSKKAIEDSKRVRPAQGTVVSGQPEGDFYSPSSGGMNPYDYFPYSGQQYQPSGDYSNQQPRQEEAKRPEEKKGGEGDKAKGTAKEPESKPKEESKDTSDDKKIRKSIEQLEGNMTEAAQAIDAINERPETAAIPADALASGVKKLKQATGNLNSLKIKIGKASNEQKRGRFKEEIREAYTIHKDALNNAKKITGIISGANKPKPSAPAINIPALSEEEKSAYVALAKEQVEKKHGQEIDYEVQRDAHVKKLSDEMIQKKINELAAQAKAQAAATQEPSEDASQSYSLQDLNKAIEDIQRAFSGF